MENQLRPLWQRVLKFDWRFGLFLIFLVCVPRFYLVLNANQTGNYSSIGLIMVASALIPFLFLNKKGRQKIGLVKSKKSNYLILAFLIGIGASFILFLLGYGLYGTSYENWYQYIGKSYLIPETISSEDKLIMFAVMALTGMTFSPIGEEFFFRGVVHESFAKSFNEKTATIIDSTAFALTHIAHFGLVYVDGNWDFYWVPALIWVVAMFLTSILFIKVKKYLNSIWGAVLCHSGFNLGMIYCIFYLL